MYYTYIFKCNNATLSFMIIKFIFLDSALLVPISYGFGRGGQISIRLLVSLWAGVIICLSNTFSNKMFLFTFDESILFN